MRYWLLVCCLCGLMSAPLVSYAQPGWEVGGWLGTTYYFGDLNTRFDLSRPGPGLGLAARYNFNYRLCMKFGANYGRVRATDANSSNDFERARNLSFASNIFELETQFEFNFLHYEHGSRDYPFTPYLFAGLSVFYFNPKAQYEGEWIGLRSLGTEGQFLGDEYYLIQPALVYGGGFKFDISPSWSINIDISARRLFTDFLDDVSGVYADKDELEGLRGPVAVDLSDRSTQADRERFNIGQAGRQRGNSKDNDSFNFIKVGLMYYFGYLPCPSILPK